MAYRLVKCRDYKGIKSYDMINVNTAKNPKTDFVENYVMEEGLTIKKGLWPLSLENKYKPEYMSVYELAKLTGIDRSTILTWCKKGLKHIKGISGHRPTKVSLHHFVMWVLYKSKHKTMNGVAGKKWTEEELSDVNSSNRSNIAKKIIKCRLGV